MLVFVLLVAFVWCLGFFVLCDLGGFGLRV